jgi:protein-S-isoprenylcysteine O-methyltransferase Ste14
MYGWALLMMAGMPLALGSWWGLLVVVPGIVELIARLLKEGEYLAASLAGYKDYKRKVRYRLIPFVW